MARARTFLIVAVAISGVALLAVQLLQRQIAGAWLAFAVHPQALELLEASLDDQRRLAELDEANRDGYRRRFDEVETLLQRLRIIEHSRDQIVGRYQRLLQLLVVGSVVLISALMLWIRSRDDRRLGRLRDALSDLAGGRTDIELGERRRDTIGRIARMIESTSRRMARDRRRLASLENLSAWQEAARRHAHEMRTPLTGARLELSRLDDLLAGDAAEPAERPESDREAARRAVDGVRQELERLGRFTQEFTSFARLPRPSLVRLDLARLLREFVGTFGAAWPALELSYRSPSQPLPRVAADRDMLRQVLVNLCDNSAQAVERSADPDREGRATRGRVELSTETIGDLVAVEVADDGPGIDPAVRSRLFEPYSTTRGIGEGMGLGLAICRKILLDHGGDLELVRSAGPGATFRLTLPRPPADRDPEIEIHSGDP